MLHRIPGLQYRFPGGRTKALVMSYDDGSEHDRRLVELFNRYGIRGSFHLNSGKLGQDHYITRREVGSLYRGHEVSCHTVNHPDLTQLPEAAIRREIGEDRATLEDLSGGPVCGLAYPFGTCDSRITALLPELGIEYARTVVTTHTFQVPQRFLEWQTTCHHAQALELGKRFLETAADELHVFYVWGHSYELAGFMTADTTKDWQYMEDFCRLLHSQDSVYYATTIDLVDYLKALRQLALSTTDAVLSNPSARPVWIRWQAADREIKPGERIVLASCPIQ